MEYVVAVLYKPHVAITDKDLFTSKLQDRRRHLVMAIFPGELPTTYDPLNNGVTDSVNTGW